MNRYKIEEEQGTLIVMETFNQLQTKYNTDKIYINVYDLYSPKVLAEANLSSRQIGVSPKVFTPYADSGYAKERKIQDKHNLSQEEFVKWIVCHEFAHIYYQTHNHTNDFFNKVEEMYIKIK